MEKMREAKSKIGLWTLKKISIPFFEKTLPRERIQLLKREDELHRELKDIEEKLNQNKKLQEKIKEFKELKQK